MPADGLRGRPKEEGGHDRFNLSVDEQTRRVLRNPELRGSSARLVEHALSQTTTPPSLVATIIMSGNEVSGLVYPTGESVAVVTFPSVGAIIAGQVVEYRFHNGQKYEGVVVATVHWKSLGEAVGSLLGSVVGAVLDSRPLAGTV